MLSNILQSINNLQDSFWLFRNSITTPLIIGHHLLSNILQSINNLQYSYWLFRNSITPPLIFNWSNHFFHLCRFVVLDHLVYSEMANLV